MSVAKKDILLSHERFGARSRWAVPAAVLTACACWAQLPAAQAATNLPACADGWQSDAVYTAGDRASQDGVNYTANWWTRGDTPSQHNGGKGSGQPWTSQGACDGGPDAPDDGDDPGNPDDGGGDNNPPSNPPVQGFVFSPYKDITINLDWNTNVMSTKLTGQRIPLVVGNNSLVSTAASDLKAITLAFATGTCGSENWGGVSKADFIGANIQSLANAGVSYVVSTGGQAGTFKCASSSGMASFIKAYKTPYMVGVDFDMEGGQTTADINNLVTAVQSVENQFPNLRFSFTLATLAASDGSYGGLNSLGDRVVKAIQAAHLKNHTINLMAMDYGRTGSGVCVVSGGACDMGQSAIQAVKNLEHTYGIPASHIELTPMIGRNDVADEIFKPADVDTVVDYARGRGLAGLHIWSLDRDTPCASSTQYASPTCNSLDGTRSLQYIHRFSNRLK